MCPVDFIFIKHVNHCNCNALQVTPTKYKVNTQDIWLTCCISVTIGCAPWVSSNHPIWQESKQIQQHRYEASCNSILCNQGGKAISRFLFAIHFGRLLFFVTAAWCESGITSLTSDKQMPCTPFIFKYCVTDTHPAEMPGSESYNRKSFSSSSSNRENSPTCPHSYVLADKNYDLLWWSSRVKWN